MIAWIAKKGLAAKKTSGLSAHGKTALDQVFGSLNFQNLCC
jgi:hypothetical protein